MFCCLFWKYVTFIILLFIVNWSGCYLKYIATFALDHRVLFAQVNIHSYFFYLSFVISPKNLSDLDFRNNRITLQASGVFKFRISLWRSFILLTYFTSILFETTYMVLVKTLCLHEHSNVLCFLILWQDLAHAVLADSRATIVKGEPFFFLFFRHVNILLLGQWFFHRCIFNKLGILCKIFRLTLLWI